MKELLLKYKNVNIWSYFWIVVAYSIVSSFLFIATTGGGYTLIGNIIFCFVGYGVLLVVALIAVIIKSFQKIYYINYFQNMFYFMLFPIQVILLFLNGGDCGDSPCRTGYDTNFLRRLLMPNYHPFLYQTDGLRLFLVLIYVTILCFVIFAPLFTKSDN